MHPAAQKPDGRDLCLNKSRKQKMETYAKAQAIAEAQGRTNLTYADLRAAVKASQAK